MKVGVVGLGYVGLPLALQFVKKQNQVVGFDVDANKVASVNAGHSYIRYIESAEIADAVKLGRLEATISFLRIKEMDAIIICVPTPLTKHREPDIQFILEAGRSIGYVVPSLPTTSVLMPKSMPIVLSVLGLG